MKITEETLKHRMAKCRDCGKATPSSLNLAFFEYRGEGSDWAVNYCECGFHHVAHHEPVRTPLTGKCVRFRPRGPSDTDSFYCGCHGWN